MKNIRLFFIALLLIRASATSADWSLKKVVTQFPEILVSHPQASEWARQAQIASPHHPADWIGYFERIEESPQRGRLYMLEAQIEALLRGFVSARANVGQFHWIGVSETGQILRRSGRPRPQELQWLQTEFGLFFSISSQGAPTSQNFRDFVSQSRRWSREVPHLYASDLNLSVTRVPEFQAIWRNGRFMRSDRWLGLSHTVRTHLGRSSLWRASFAIDPRSFVIIKFDPIDETRTRVSIRSPHVHRESTLPILRRIATALDRTEAIPYETSEWLETLTVETELNLEDAVQRIQRVAETLHVWTTSQHRALRSICERQFSLRFDAAE